MTTGVGASEDLNLHVRVPARSHGAVEHAADEGGAVGDARRREQLADCLGTERLDGEHSPVAVDDVHAAAGLQHAAHLDECGPEVGDIFQNVLGDYAIERAVCERNPLVGDVVKTDAALQSFRGDMRRGSLEKRLIDVERMHMSARAHPASELDRQPAGSAAEVENGLSRGDLGRSDQRVHLRAPTEHLLVRVEPVGLDGHPMVSIVGLGAFHRRRF